MTIREPETHHRKRADSEKEHVAEVESMVLEECKEQD